MSAPEPPEDELIPASSGVRHRDASTGGGGSTGSDAVDGAPEDADAVAEHADGVSDADDSNATDDADDSNATDDADDSNATDDADDSNATDDADDSDAFEKTAGQADPERASEDTPAAAAERASEETGDAAAERASEETPAAADSAAADTEAAARGESSNDGADASANEAARAPREASRRGRRIGWPDHLIGLALCASYVALLLATSLDIGMARDEGFYVTAADRYGDWFEILFEDADRAMTREAVDRAWGYNHEHPSLVKSGFALVRLADQAWEIFDQPSMSYRFFGMLTGGLLLWLIYIFGARVFGRQAGVFAALAFALIPRIFYHAHLDCFDIPIVVMMTLVTYCYWRSLSDWRWVILTGLSYGLALETKHNAWTLPAIFLIHWLFVVFHERRARRAGQPKRVSYVPWWLLAMVLLGPPIFVALWPWMWWDTATRFGEYAGFHLNHVHYNMAYFGVNYYRPPLPMGFPWVMTLYTVPLATLALAAAGVASRLRTLLPPGLLERLWPNGTVKPDRTRTDVLLFGAMMAPLVVISMPWTPIFGGTKHWFSAYPFLAMFAGAAFVWVARNVTARLPAKVPARRYVARVGAGLLLLSPALAETQHSHPFGLSHYGFAAGGVPGAADDGMNRQFWGFTTRSLVPYFNERLAEGGSVWICDMTPTAFRMLQQDGLLNPRVRATGDLIRADYAIVHHEHHFFEVDYQIWTAWGDVRPVHVLTYDGVPIVSVYENPRRARR